MKLVGTFLVVCAFALAGDFAAAQASEPPQATASPAPRAALEDISADELMALLEAANSDLVILDVRTSAEFAAGHVPGARNVAHDQLAVHLDQLAALRDRQIVVYCRSGRRSALAEEVLRGAGFSRLLHLRGDYLAWEAANLPIERTD